MKSQRQQNWGSDGEIIFYLIHVVSNKIFIVTTKVQGLKIPGSRFKMDKN
jgi:hypothetical protein